VSKLFACFMIAILIALPACGGGDDDDDGGDVTSVEDVETCEQLADLTIDEMQVLLDGLSDMTLEDMQSGETPEPVSDFEAKGEEFQSKADEIGCDDAEYQSLIEDRVDQLEADGPVAELVLEALQSGSLFEGLE
jgi:hypothetical protein